MGTEEESVSGRESVRLNGGETLREMRREQG